MSAVGIASIVLGVLIFISRGWMVIAPASILRWTGRMIETDRKLRVAGVICLLPSAALIWAGGTGNTTLALILTLMGWWILVVGTMLLILFPAMYRELAGAFVSIDDGEELLGWRMIGLFGMAIGYLFIIYGEQAL